MKIENLIGEILVHRVFGNGVIKEVHEKYLEVEFPEKKKHCKFLYPSCFNGYVRLENREKQRRAQTDLRIWKEESGALLEEEMKEEYEKTQQEIIARRKAAEEKRLLAARKSMEYRTVYQR